VKFVFEDKMLQYFHNFMVSTYIAKKFSQNIWVLLTILAANGQTWLKKTLAAAKKYRAAYKTSQVVA